MVSAVNFSSSPQVYLQTDKQSSVNPLPEQNQPSADHPHAGVDVKDLPPSVQIAISVFNKLSAAVILGGAWFYFDKIALGVVGASYATAYLAPLAAFGLVSSVVVNTANIGLIILGERPGERKNALTNALIEKKEQLQGLKDQLERKIKEENCQRVKELYDHEFCVKIVLDSTEKGAESVHTELSLVPIGIIPNLEQQIKTLEAELAAVNAIHVNAFRKFTWKVIEKIENSGAKVDAVFSRILRIRSYRQLKSEKPALHEQRFLEIMREEVLSTFSAGVSSFVIVRLGMGFCSKLKCQLVNTIKDGFTLKGLATALTYGGISLQIGFDYMLYVALSTGSTRLFALNQGVMALHNISAKLEASLSTRTFIDYMNRSPRIAHYVYKKNVEDDTFKIILTVSPNEEYEIRDNDLLDPGLFQDELISLYKGLDNSQIKGKALSKEAKKAKSILLSPRPLKPC